MLFGSDRPGLDGGEVDADDLCAGEFVRDVDRPAGDLFSGCERGEESMYHVPAPVPRSSTGQKISVGTARATASRRASAVLPELQRLLHGADVVSALEHKLQQTVMDV